MQVTSPRLMQSVSQQTAQEYVTLATFVASSWELQPQ